MIKNNCIGIFDSGLGGLSVLKSIKEIMPNESFVYLGDSLNAPYGVKDKDEVFRLSKAICDQLVLKGVKAIVIACNTATSAAADRLREMYEIPIIGMEPAIKPALNQVEGRVFVFATEMTLKEDKFNLLVEKYDEGHRIIKCPAPEWVTAVENHFDDQTYVQSEIRKIISKYEITSNDAIVLGCTHFVFLREAIEGIVGTNVEIFDGNMGTALQLQNILKQNQLLADDLQKSQSIEILNTKSDALIEISKQLLEIEGASNGK